MQLSVATISFLFTIIPSSQSFSVYKGSQTHKIDRFGNYPSTSRLMANSHSGDIGSRWRIWSVIDELQTNGLSSSSSNSHNSNNKQYDDMIQEVIQILTLWGVTWAGQDAHSSLLDKTTLYHEVEESIIALHVLVEWLQQRNEQTAITLVDACCGKGILCLQHTSFVIRPKLKSQTLSCWTSRRI